MAWWASPCNDGGRLPWGALWAHSCAYILCSSNPALSVAPGITLGQSAPVSPPSLGLHRHGFPLHIPLWLWNINCCRSTADKEGREGQPPSGELGHLPPGEAAAHHHLWEESLSPAVSSTSGAPPTTRKDPPSTGSSFLCRKFQGTCAEPTLVLGLSPFGLTELLFLTCCLVSPAFHLNLPGSLELKQLIQSHTWVAYQNS